MGQSIPFGTAVGTQANLSARAVTATETVPWTIWCMIAGVVSGMIGGPWDISWHMSIGRDTFWTPAHFDSIGGGAGGVCMRVDDFEHDVWKRCTGAKRVGENLGISRAAGGVHCGVGMHRDADIGAVRQLVAQRVWP